MSGVIAKKTVPVASLKNWEKNPRYIKHPEDYEKLKEQIELLGDYKPLVVANDETTVLGGNMRLKAYKELGKEMIDVVVVDAPDDATKVQYMLSDNDSIGAYDREKLQEVVFKSDISIDNLEPFRVDFGEPIPVLNVVAEVMPSFNDDDEKEEKTKKPKLVTCPDCGAEFET